MTFSSRREIPPIPIKSRGLPKDFALDGGRYHTVQQRGQGGLGITYLGRDRLNGDVAIKELFPRGCMRYKDIRNQFSTVRDHDSGAELEKEYKVYYRKFCTEKAWLKIRQQFRREATLLAELRNYGNIVYVADHFVDEDTETDYIVMQYIEGDSLQELHNKARNTKGVPLPTDTVLSYIYKVCHALKQAHDKDIMHLDFKPSNILLRDEQPVLVDFGSARELVWPIDGSFGDFFSPEFAAPELNPAWRLENGSRDGNQVVFGRHSDVYSLGATCYYLLTGVYFKDAGDDPWKLLGMEGSPVETALKGALEQDPSARTQVITNFQRELGKALEGTLASPSRQVSESTTANPPTRLYDGSSFAASASAWGTPKQGSVAGAGNVSSSATNNHVKPNDAAPDPKPADVQADTPKSAPVSGTIGDLEAARNTEWLSEYVASLILVLGGLTLLLLGGFLAYLATSGALGAWGPNTGNMVGTTLIVLLIVIGLVDFGFMVVALRRLLARASMRGLGFESEDGKEYRPLSGSKCTLRLNGSQFTFQANRQTGKPGLVASSIKVPFAINNHNYDAHNKPDAITYMNIGDRLRVGGVVYTLKGASRRMAAAQDEL